MSHITYANGEPRKDDPTAGALRAVYCNIHFGFFLSPIHIDRLKFFGISMDEAREQADRFVFQYGLDGYGFDFGEELTSINSEGNPIFDELREQQRNYYVRKEIANRNGWSFTAQKPIGYDAFEREFNQKLRNQK